MPIMTGVDRHQMFFSSWEDKIAVDNEVRFIDALETNTKKAVTVELLLVHLKATLRKLHNTLLATYGLTHLFYLFWYSLNVHFVQWALLHILIICFGVQ